MLQISERPVSHDASIVQYIHVRVLNVSLNALDLSRAQLTRQKTLTMPNNRMASSATNDAPVGIPALQDPADFRRGERPD
jgi:hypothetical protein